MKVLVIDDEVELCEVVERALQRDGHAVARAANARQAQAMIVRESFELFIVDLGLPDETGIELCRWLRRRGNQEPVLILTAQSAVASRVSSLDAGADDYLSKPFAVAELRARARALGRRGVHPGRFVTRHGNVEIDFSARRASIHGTEAPITAREWTILELLASRQGRIVRRDELLEQVWGDVETASSASLEVLIGRIRKKLEPSLIRTLRGEGYAFGGSAD